MTDAVRRRTRRPVRSVEWPTLGIAVAIYGGWLALTWWHRSVPAPMLVLAGAWLIAWHGSLQHEVIHRHPTGRRSVDDAIGFPPLSLWLPYAIYRRSHLAHHRSAWITHPDADPESRYVVADTGFAGFAAKLQATLVTRLLLGPAIAAASLITAEMRRVRHQPLTVARDWLPHLAGCALVIGWLAACGFDLVRYVLLFVYPGTALTLLRSYAEHHAEARSPGRAVTVRHGGPLGLLFLNNHLHAAHHARPALAWYRLPAFQRQRETHPSAVDEPAYRSYGTIVRRFALHRHHVLVHPGSASE
jgi:fatty acid desaturase